MSALIARTELQFSTCFFCVFCRLAAVLIEFCSRVFSMSAHIDCCVIAFCICFLEQFCKCVARIRKLYIFLLFSCLKQRDTESGFIRFLMYISMIWTICIALGLLYSTPILVLICFSNVFDPFCEHSMGTLCDYVFNGCAKILILFRFSKPRRCIT